MRSRGASINPHNHFLEQRYSQEEFYAIDDWEQGSNLTQYFEEHSKTVVNKVNSPDVGMSWSLNPYQGCEHGCIYCYARNSHQYWGYSAGKDFEQKIIIKKNAVELLRKTLDHPAWQAAVISLSGNTDCYQPVERREQLTRQLLKTMLEYKNPVSILTKNALILRDTDLLQELNRYGLVMVYTSITGVSEEIRRKLEPRTSTYATRFKILNQLSSLGIPTGVMNAPLIPGINDQEMAEVLRRSAESGAVSAGYTVVRLNGPIGGIFQKWLKEEYPDREQKVWNHICSLHNGMVNDNRTGTRIKGEGELAKIIKLQFSVYCRKFGLNKKSIQLNTHLYKRPGQLF